MQTNNLSIEIIEFKSFASTVADEIVASIIESINENGTVSVALSGGSTPSAVYRALTLPPRVNDVEWDKVQLFFGDERYVDHKDTQSNFRMVNETLINPLLHIGKKCSIYPVDTAQTTPAKSAEMYAQKIEKEIVAKSSDGTPLFDIILLGIGEDGHTASIFPGNNILKDNSLLISNTLNSNDNTERITFAPRLLRNAKKVFFLITGENKADMTKKILTPSEEDVMSFPALLHKSFQGKVTFFLDSGASSKMSLK